MRLEFFGDELESLRFFDPLTQLGRPDPVASIALPPAGELGLLKKAVADAASSSAASPALATLLDHCGSETIMVVCQAEHVEERAGEYASQVPAQDPFFIEWDQLQSEAAARGVNIVNLEGAPDDTEKHLALVPQEEPHRILWGSLGRRVLLWDRWCSISLPVAAGAMGYPLLLSGTDKS